MTARNFNAKNRSERRMPFVNAASQQELEMLRAFFCSFGSDDKIILSRFGFKGLRNCYEVPNPSNAGPDAFLLKMSRIKLQGNTYMSVNPRYVKYADDFGRRPMRRDETIKCLDRIVIDVDFAGHNHMDYAYAEKAWVDLQEFFIRPFALVYTGRGFQVHFMLKPEPAVYRFKYAYGRIVRSLCEDMAQFLQDHNFPFEGIDVLNENAICRLPGSYNIKAKEYVKVAGLNKEFINIEKRSDLEWFIHLYGMNMPMTTEEWKIYKEQKRLNKKNSNSVTRSVLTMRGSLPKRMWIAYSYMIQNGTIKKGDRNKGLYCYAYNSFSCEGTKGSHYEAICQATYALNDMLDEPLPCHEVKLLLESAKRQAEEKHRFYSMYRQVTWILSKPFDLSECEKYRAYNAELRKKSCASASKRYQARQKTARRSKKHKLIMSVYAEFKKLHSISAVARAFHLARATVRKYIAVCKAVNEGEHLKWEEAFHRIGLEHRMREVRKLLDAKAEKKTLQVMTS